MKSAPVVEPRARDYIRPAAGAEVHPTFQGTRLDAAIPSMEQTLLLDYVIKVPGTSTDDIVAAMAAPTEAEREKQLFYNTRLPGGNYGRSVVKLLAFSAIGRTSIMGIETINSMAESLSCGSAVQKAVILRRLQDTISVALCRGNSGIYRAYSAVLTGNRR
jgi:hypothetical protein